MPKHLFKSWLGLTVLATSLAACRAPSLIAPTRQSPASTVQASSAVTTSTASPKLGGYSAPASEIAELHKHYQTLGVEPDDLVIPTNTSWTTVLPKSTILEVLAARLDYPIVAGGNPAMQVFINGQVVSQETAPLINKSNVVKIADGRTGTYWNPDYQAWALNYSPNFVLNNTPAAGGYQVISDPGQAYRYVWNISALINSSATMDLRIHHNGLGAGMPIIVRLAPSLNLKVGTPFISPNNDGTCDVASLSIKTTGAWKLSVVDQGQIANGSGNQSISWDGKLNGQKLPDGQYRLRLEQDSPNPTMQAVEGAITIDTTPPSITDVDIAQVDPGNNSSSYKIRAIIADKQPGQVDKKSIAVDFSGYLGLLNIRPTYEEGSSQLTYLVDILPSDQYASNIGGTIFGDSGVGIATAYRTSSLDTEKDLIRIKLLVRDMAGNLGLIERDLNLSPIILKAEFNAPYLSPLGDGETSQDKAQKTTITISALKDNKPISAMVQIKAISDPQSGGHDHDGTGRPLGSFRKNGSQFQNEMTVFIDTSGQSTIEYRCSGIGGRDTILVYGQGAQSFTTKLRVTYNLIKLGEDGNDIPNIHFVGRTDDHTQNHYCSTRTRDAIIEIARQWSLWAEKNNRSDTRLWVNDSSLPDGGPFDLGPTYHVPFWTLTKRHLNHRQGDSTDIPVGNKALKLIIKANNGSIFDEGNTEHPHWHITTR